MKNAHLRFGFAEFEKVHKDAASKIRLIADQFIGEPESGDAHLLSVFGGDSDVSAMAAAIQLNEPVLVGGPGLAQRQYRFGERSSVYRGTIDCLSVSGPCAIWSRFRVHWKLKEIRTRSFCTAILRNLCCNASRSHSAYLCCLPGPPGFLRGCILKRASADLPA